MEENLLRQREEAVERTRGELRVLIRESGWTQRRIEEANGFTQGYLSQVLQGHITLTVRHLLGVLLTIGMQPADFFKRLFGRSSTEELRERMDRHEALFELLERQGLLDPEAPNENGPTSGDS